MPIDNTVTKASLVTVALHTWWANFTSWSSLWRYSHTQIVVFGTYVTLFIPVVAHAILFIDKAFGTDVVVPDWRLFATQLYISGLFIFFARLVTQLLCPHRIQRFPHEDDHFVYIGTIKRAKTEIEALVLSARAAEDPSSDSDAQRLIEGYAELLAAEEGNSEAINSAWRDDNIHLSPIRNFVGGFYLIGTIGVVLFLLWRAGNNLDAVARILPG